MFHGVGMFAFLLERRQLRGLLRHLCGMGIHSLRLGSELQRLGLNHLRELLEIAHQRFLGLSHLLSSSIVRLGLFYRE